MEKVKKSAGRPRKPEHEKVQYQLIAVHAPDYKKLVTKLNQEDKKITEAFSDMVESYVAG